MRNRKVTQKSKKQLATNTSKLRELRIILYDIVLYPKLIPPQYKPLLKQQLKQITNTSCTNHNIQFSKQNVQSSKCSRSTEKSSLKSISLKNSRKKHETIKSRLRSKDLKSVEKTNKCDEVFQSRSVKHKWQLIIDDDKSSTSGHISNEISHIPKNTVLANTKVSQHTWSPTADTDRLDTISTSSQSSGTNVESAKVGSDGTNYLDKKNLIYIDYNSKTQEVSSDEVSIASIKYDHNLAPVDSINESNHRIKQKRSQGKKSLTIPSVENEVFTKSVENAEAGKISKNLHSSDILLSTPSNKVNGKEDQHDTRTKSDNYGITPAIDLKSTNIIPETAAINHITKDNLPKTYNENKSRIIEQTLPKITQDAILPKGTVKLIKLDETYSNARNISKNSNLIQNRPNKKDKNVKQVEDKDILEKEENHISFTEIESIKTSKTSESILKQKNSIQQDSNILDNDGFHNKVVNHDSQNSLTITQNDICNNIRINDSSIETVTNINCTVDHQIQSRKRTAEENSTNVNTCAKRIKLKRNFQQSNVKTYNEPVNTTTKDVECKNADLREILDRKRTKQVCNLETTDNDKIINNTTSMKVNNKNSVIDVTNVVENKETCETSSEKEASTFNKSVFEKQNNGQMSLSHNNLYLSDDLYDTSKKTYCNQTNRNTCKKTNVQKKCTDVVSTNNDCDTEEDDDCISLFANETFDISCCEDMFPNKQEKLSKSLQSDTPYIMSTNSFNEYLKQNKNEFNKEYERCMKNNVNRSQIAQKMKVIKDSSPKMCNENKLLTAKQTLSKIETQNVLLPKERLRNKLLEQTSRTDSLPTSSTNLTLSAVQNTHILMNRNMQYYFNGFCFSILMHSTCNSQYSCTFNHEFQNFIKKFYFKDSNKIIDIINYAICKKFYFFCQRFYKMSLKILSIDQILAIYKRFYDICILSEDITSDIINELLSRGILLKNIVDQIVTYINSSSTTAETKNYENVTNKNHEIFQCLKQFMKRGEYWYIAKSMVLILTPNKYTVDNILYDCICHGKLSDIQDINNMLINKLHPGIISRLDEHLMTRFKNLLNGKTAKDGCTKSVQDFGESFVEMDTIASPDSKQDSPKSYSNVINRSQTNNIKRRDQEITATSSRPYILHPIDNLPEARSVYRNHEHLWKFYMDLERFKKGLEHQDYDYVIDILEEYAGKQDDTLFVRTCGNMLRTEIKRTDQHLINIIRRTVQTGTFAILRKILLHIGINILVALMDEEAWRLAFHFITSLKTCDLPSSAEFTMLSAEIYLANKKTLEAFDLIKNKNIICTSRTKWSVTNTIHDEYVRNKLMYILLDSLCNDLIEHAFFLFTFLLRDQSSQFYPIDLSRYVDKLTMLLLSRNKMTLIIEMGNLILKYNFPINAKACRALIATLIHADEKLAIQLYNYAEAIGLYSTIELWPIMHIIIKNDLTEEEIYLVTLQLLEKLKVNFGHTIEFIKSHFAVYIILEVKSKEQFYCTAKESRYNTRAIANIKSLVRYVLKTRFDPPISLIARAKEKICRLQNKSLINYLKSKHCN